jgi:hypothetical protein
MNKNGIEIGKSVIEMGQMFIQFPQPIADNQPKPKPRVWVKVANETISGEQVSLFVDNNAIVKMTIKAITQFGIRDKWYITDSYYGHNVRNGNFVPIDDISETDAICEQAGYPPYEIELF